MRGTVAAAAATAMATGGQAHKQYPKAHNQDPVSDEATI